MDSRKSSSCPRKLQGWGNDIAKGSSTYVLFQVRARAEWPARCAPGVSTLLASGPPNLPQLLVISHWSHFSNKIMPHRARVAETHHDKTKGAEQETPGGAGPRAGWAYQARAHACACTGAWTWTISFVRRKQTSPGTNWQLSGLQDARLLHGKALSARRCHTKGVAKSLSAASLPLCPAGCVPPSQGAPSRGPKKGCTGRLGNTGAQGKPPLALAVPQEPRILRMLRLRHQQARGRAGAGSSGFRQEVQLRAWCLGGRRTEKIPNSQLHLASLPSSPKPGRVKRQEGPVSGLPHSPGHSWEHMQLPPRQWLGHMPQGHLTAAGYIGRQASGTLLASL